MADLSFSKRIILTLIILSVVITPVDATEVLNETVNIGFINFTSFIIDVDKQASVSISVQVTSGNDISLYFSDTVNYNKWLDGESAEVLIDKPDIVEGSYTVTLNDGGRYYVILDNMDSLTGTSVKIIVNVAYPTTSPSGDSYNLIILLIGVIIIGIIVALAIRGKNKSVIQNSQTVDSDMNGVAKKRDQQVEKPKKQGQDFIECNSCGTINRMPSDWCVECGVSLNT